MSDLRVFPSKLQGTLFVPSSKSHTLRAILFGALAKGTSRISRYLPSPDTFAMIEAVKLLGAEVNTGLPNVLTIEGFDGRPAAAKDVINCGNSGLVLRLIGAIGGLIPSYTILTGDASIRERRPAQPLLDGLNQLGVFAESSRGDHYAPILVKGPFTKISALIDGRDSQPVSGLLIAAAFAPHPIEIQVKNPGETPWIDLTLDWFDRLKIRYRADRYNRYNLEGSAKISGFNYDVPGDFSTAAFPIAAALLTESELTLENIDLNDIQGDKWVISLLEQMGARFMIDPIKRTLKVEKGAALQGIKIDVNRSIDALPILAVVGCFAKGKTELFNGAIAREKESDRIASIASELKKMGARIEEKPDGLIIYQSDLCGAEVAAHHDHRLGLSLTVAALAAKNSSTIRGVECIAKTYPHFFENFRAIGAQLE